MEKTIEKYIEEFENNSNFDFVDNTKLKEILYFFYGYVFFLYFEEIKASSTSNKLKEIKAHTIFVYLGSIIEAIIYYFAETKLTDEKAKRKYLEETGFRPLNKINETTDLYICKLETKEVSLNDSTNFYALINGIKDRNLLDKKLINKIDYCRKMRNLIHANVLLTSEYKLFDELDKVFTYTKEIIDEMKGKLK